MHSRLIKTLLIGLLLLVIAALGLSYYTGYAGEQAVRQQLQLNQDQASRRGYELDLERYDRGWFTSRAVLRLQPLDVPTGQPSLNGLELQGELRLRHGPLLLLEDEWRLGLFALQATLGPDSDLGSVTVDVPTERLLDRLLIVGRLNGDYEISWPLPDAQLQQGEQVVNLRGAQFFWQGPYDQMAGRGELSFEHMKIQWPEALSLTVTDSALELELAYRQDWVLEGYSQLRSQQGVWAGPGQLPIRFSQLEWQWTQEVAQGRVDTVYQLDLGQLDAGPLALKALAATTQIQGVPVRVLRNWQQLSRERQASGLHGFDANAWLAVADEGLRQELRAWGTLEAQVGQGDLSADWQADYRGVSAGELINATEWRDWVALVDAQLTLSVSETALTGTPLYWLFAEAVDRYLPPGDSQRHFEAVWHEGKLELNP